MIPVSIPHLSGNEWDYVKQALDSGWVSSAGPFVERFETNFAECVGAPFAVATSTGTSALHVALRVGGVRADDEVLVQTLTFIASANAVRYLGAWPVFMDADPSFWQMDPSKVQDFLRTQCEWHEGALRNRRTRRRVKAIMPVHVLGHPAPLAELYDLAREFGLLVVEDAAEGLGARYDWESGGADREHDRAWPPIGQRGDLVCFSFNGNKTITAGAGGMVTTGKSDWANRARHLTTQAKDDADNWVHDEIGYNYRMSNVHAAIGCAQLERLEEFVERKREIAACYARELRDVACAEVYSEAPWARSSFWLSALRVDMSATKRTVLDICLAVARDGCGARRLWQPLHLSPPYRAAESYACEHAVRLYEETICLPSAVGMTDAEQATAVEILRGVL